PSSVGRKAIRTLSESRREADQWKSETSSSASCLSHKLSWPISWAPLMSQQGPETGTGGPETGTGGPETGAGGAATGRRRRSRGGGPKRGRARNGGPKRGRG